MDKGLQTELQRYQKALEKTREIRCSMIDVEMSVSVAKQILGIHDWGMFARGEYKDWEKMADILQKEVKKYPDKLKERDKNFKTLKKAMILHGMSIKELEEIIGVNCYKIYRVVRGITRDQEIKNKLEKELNVKFLV